MESYRVSDDVKEEALEAEVAYKGFIKFIKWISVIAILLILVMGFNNFLDDFWHHNLIILGKEDYESNMGLDE